MRTTTIIALSAISSLFLACGGSTPASRTPADVKGGPGGGAAAAAAPARTISGEAKADLAKAVKQYEEAAKAGLNKTSCANVAAELARVASNHPKLVEAKFNEGVVWEECGDLARAEQAYQDVLRQHPSFGPALNNLGQLYFSRGQVDRAVDYFKRAADQKNSEGYANIAVVQRNKALRGEVSAVQEAINNIHRALAVDSFNIEAYGTLALVLYDHAKTHSQLEMARLICLQAIKVDDKYAPIYNVLGLILLRMGRVTPALAEFRRAVALDNNFLEAHMNIGAVTLSFRDYKSAEESFSRVLSLSPDKKTKVEAAVGLGVAYRGQRRYNEAMAKYKEAQALDPGNLDIAYNMGILAQDYTFDASNPAAGIQQLRTAAGLLQRYVSGGKNAEKRADAQRRLKNINELIPMLEEQQKMAQGS